MFVIMIQPALQVIRAVEDDTLLGLTRRESE